ncbi:ATPase domain-containing protein [Chloroflexota bacterium]
MEKDAAKKELVLTGVPEVDEKLGGGIPVGSLVLIEGHSDAGKSVLCQHLAHGTLATDEVSVAYYTTENTIRSLIAQMDSLSLFTIDYLLADRFYVFPLSFHSTLLKDGRKPFTLMAHHFSNLPERVKLIIVDSITLLVSHSNPVSIIDFFSECKQICDQDRSIILVAHSYAFEEDMLARTRSLCDARFRLKLEQMGDRLVKNLEVLKVHGAERPTGDVVSFDIEPKSGIRIIPLSKARV